MNHGRTLKLFLVDGSPTGVITAQLGNWSGKAVVAPRTGLAALIAREEASRTGIYILVGPDLEVQGRQRVYVGEGDNVRNRLRIHDADPAKDFFTRACLIVSKDENLTKAHGRYLESRLIAAIKTAGRAKLANGTAPDFAGLPEDERADMEAFLDHIEIILPVLGFDILQPLPEIAFGSVMPPTVEFDLTTTFGANARMIERAGEFVVLKGSIARFHGVPSWSEGTRALRDRLIDEGKLSKSDDGSSLVFQDDVAFESISVAASVVTARPQQGPVVWKVKGTNQTYADWRAALLAQAGQSPGAA
jgi:hypothetical protein